MKGRTPGIFRCALLASALACSSSNDGATSASSSSSGGTGSSSGTASSTSSSSSGGAATKIVQSATKITTSVAISAGFVAVRANGNLVITDYTANKLFEVKPDGTLVATNTSDFSSSTKPGRLAIDGSDKVYVLTGGKKIRVFGADLSAPGAEYLAQAASNDPYVQDIAWGGTNRSKLFALVQALPKSNMVRFDASTATAAGVATTVGTLDAVGQTIAVDATSSSFTYELNGCRITRFSATGEKKVVVGDATVNQCAIGALQSGRTGQGSGMHVDGAGHLLFAEKMNGRIMEFTVATDGTTSQRALYEKSDFRPVELDVAPDGTIYVIDDTNQLWRLAF